MLGHCFLGISGRSRCAPLNRVLVLHSRSFYHLATGNKPIWNGSIWSWKKSIIKMLFFSWKLSSLYFFPHILPKSPRLTAINCVRVPALSLTTSILQSSHFLLLGGLSLLQLTDRWTSNLHSQLKSNLKTYWGMVLRPALAPSSVRWCLGSPREASSTDTLLFLSKYIRSSVHHEVTFQS